MYYELTDRFVVPASLQKTWAFFSDAGNLPRITPPWLNFRIDTPGPIHLGVDSLIDYTIRWMSIPIHWRTRIIQWREPNEFIDLQVRGPYRLWHHHHTFEQTPEGTQCSDCVIYALPFPPLDRVAHALTVRRQLLEIFQFRRRVIGEELGFTRELQPGVQIRKL